MNDQTWPFHHVPYTKRSIEALQAEIDAYEDAMPHDQLPARYDLLIALRNKRITENKQSAS